jgi:hypothetical protein
VWLEPSALSIGAVGLRLEEKGGLRRRVPPIIR